MLQLLREHPPPHMGQRGAGAGTAGGGGSSGSGGGAGGQQEQGQGQGKQLGPRPLYLCGDSHCLSGEGYEVGASARWGCGRWGEEEGWWCATVGVCGAQCKVRKGTYR